MVAEIRVYGQGDFGVTQIDRLIKHTELLRETLAEDALERGEET